MNRVSLLPVIGRPWTWSLLHNKHT